MVLLNGLFLFICIFVALSCLCLIFGVFVFVCCVLCRCLHVRLVLSYPEDRTLGEPVVETIELWNENQYILYELEDEEINSNKSVVYRFLSVSVINGYLRARMQECNKPMDRHRANWTKTKRRITIILWRASNNRRQICYHQLDIDVSVGNFHTDTLENTFSFSSTFFFHFPSEFPFGLFENSPKSKKIIFEFLICRLFLIPRYRVSAGSPWKFP